MIHSRLEEALFAPGETIKKSPSSYSSPQESGFYYLKSRYYDPKICRFINADGLASTGQGFLGCNMFAYCNNNPIRYADYDGEQLVGIGFTVDVTTGNTTFGVDIVLYFDAEVVSSTSDDNEKKFSLAYYSYSGVSFSTNDLLENSIISDNIYLLVGLLSSGAFDEAIESLNLGKTTVDELLMSMVGLLSQTGEFSGGIFLIIGNETFKNPDAYSGGFDTYSFTIKKLGSRAGITGYVSTSPYCTVYGIKATCSSEIWLWPVAVSYSKTSYSDPIMIY